MSKLKKYTANTQVSVNIVLPNGKSTRIAFSGKTLGKSTYYTSYPDIQSGLENHYRFGTLFALDPDFEAPKPAKNPKKKKETTDNAETATELSEVENPEDETSEDVNGDESEDEYENGDESEGEQTPESEEMAFSDYGAAKEYLCKTYGLSRTKLKTQASIEEAASSFGLRLKIE